MLKLVFVNITVSQPDLAEFSQHVHAAVIYKWLIFDRKKDSYKFCGPC